MRQLFRCRSIASILLGLGVVTLDAATAQVGKNQGLVNPNLAGQEELAKIPGLTKAAVDAILSGRPFLSMTDLHAALSPHVAKDGLDALYRALWVPINLNTASRDEILLIPSAGPRMAREFNEYRPYRALAQFHREIGKYVNDEELARLEQYVFVPIDLNTASDDAILSIPGVGQRMLREFKEYRPYTNIAQFRREIGKYVNDKEVARLERYVEVR